MADALDRKSTLDLGTKPRRAEITDPTAIESLNLRPTADVLDHIRKLEEAGVLAEQ